MEPGMAMTPHPQMVRGNGLEQDTAHAATETPEVRPPLPAWPRVRASGFAHGLPPSLIEALRACATPGGRIEMGPWAPGSAGQSLVDLHLIAVDGPEADLAALADGTGRALAICVERDEATALRAIAAGAEGVLYLHDGTDELAKALRAATSGAPALTPSAARALIAHARATAFQPAPGQVAGSGAQAANTANDASAAEAGPSRATIRLSAREREIIRLADQGCTFTQAARLLGVQVSTVYTHVRRLYEKLSVNSLPQALHEARRRGLL